MNSLKNKLILLKFYPANKSILLTMRAAFLHAIDMKIFTSIFLTITCLSCQLCSQLDPMSLEQLTNASEKIASMMSILTKNPNLVDSMKLDPATLKKGIIRIPKFGTFKFKESASGQTKGTLYTPSEKQVKRFSLGPIKITKISVVLSAEEPPTPEIDISLFGIPGKLFKSESDDEDVMKFILLLEQPFKIPVGVNKFLELKSFTCIFSEDEKLLQTETTLPTADKPKVSIKANLSETPFLFSIATKALPITVLSDVIEQTPLKDLKLDDVKFNFVPSPFKLAIAGKANIAPMAKKIHINLEDKPVEVIAQISKEDGLLIKIDLPDITLPLEMGTIKAPTLTFNPKELAKSANQKTQKVKTKRKK